MAIIPGFFMDAVVALGIKQPDGKMFWTGTGFIVGRKEKEDPSKSTCYVITNKHVVNGKQMLYVRFNSKGPERIKDMEMDLIINGQEYYSRHPVDAVDVVAIQIDPNAVVNNDSTLGFFDLDDHALTLKQMQDTGVQEGCLVYSLGFPMNLVHDLMKAPICRLGCISRVSDDFISPGNAPHFLVDAPVFPGNSGGPIISRPEKMSITGTPHNENANLIGILSAYIPYNENLINAQTGNVQMVRTENSGLTVVHPVDRIKEVVELEWSRCETIRLKHDKLREKEAAVVG